MQRSGSGDAGGCVIPKGMYSLMKGLGLGLKVPRPHSDKADAKQQMAWKKGAYWMPWARLE